MRNQKLLFFPQWGLGFLWMGPTPDHFRLSPTLEVPDVCCFFVFFFAFLINDEMINIYVFLCLNFITMYVSIDGQKLIRAYVLLLCTVMRSLNTFSYLILSYHQGHGQLSTDSFM